MRFMGQRWKLPNFTNNFKHHIMITKVFNLTPISERRLKIFTTGHEKYKALKPNKSHSSASFL